MTKRFDPIRLIDIQILREKGIIQRLIHIVRKANQHYMANKRIGHLTINKIQSGIR